jgi:hypothetical protein
MSTLLGSMNARGNGPSSRPSHPVDAALWGLAERLAGGSEATPAETVATPPIDERLSTDLRTSQVRVVRLPQRAGGLPSVGRMGQRNRTGVAPAVGIPTKPISAAAVQTPPKPSASSAAGTPRRKQLEPQMTAPRPRRAEFTILKGRNGVDRQQPDPKSSANSEIRQESPASSEENAGDRSKVRRSVRRKRRAGVTIFGWLALTAVAAAAAAIALFWPSWF